MPITLLLSYYCSSLSFMVPAHPHESEKNDCFPLSHTGSLFLRRGSNQGVLDENPIVTGSQHVSQGTVFVNGDLGLVHKSAEKITITNVMHISMSFCTFFLFLIHF